MKEMANPENQHKLVYGPWSFSKQCIAVDKFRNSLCMEQVRPKSPSCHLVKPGKFMQC